MKKYPRLFLCLLLILLPALSLWAADFGLVLDQTADYSGYGSDGSFGYTGSLIPRFSALLGDTADIYISASIGAEYRNGWTFVPELLRTELTFIPGNWEIKLGRMNYSDPLGFVAEGLFDGLGVFLDSTIGTFSAGGWYTGFLYKDRIDIGITQADEESNAVPFDFGDFQNTYFAPRRVVAALGWEHLGIGALEAKLALLGQFDLSDGERLNSQYAVGKISLSGSSLVFDLGGCFELLQNSEDADLGMAAAGEAGISWTPGTDLRQRLSLLARYASGGTDGTITAFRPITTEYQGNIFKPKLSGMSMLSLDYLARLHYTLSVGLSSACFVRTDLGTYKSYPLVVDTAGDGYFLGTEFFGRLFWSPASDLQINLGGGVFMPSLGNAAPDVENAWRVELGAVFSLL